VERKEPYMKEILLDTETNRLLVVEPGEGSFTDWFFLLEHGNGEVTTYEVSASDERWQVAYSVKTLPYNRRSRSWLEENWPMIEKTILG
jgi:hypothetical protein